MSGDNPKDGADEAPRSRRRVVTVATRKSLLALAQSRAWMAILREKSGVDTEELLVVTTGDKIQDRPLNEVGGKGLFLKEIEEALLAGEADLAVHSLKDVPAQLARWNRAGGRESRGLTRRRQAEGAVFERAEYRGP